MYHIQPDKRAQKSAALILEGLQRCMADKRYESVTITDICMSSTVSRATFYRLFDTKDDVISWGMDLFIADFCTRISGRSMREKLESYFAAWMANPDLLDLITVIRREDISRENRRKRIRLLEQHFMMMSLSDHHVMILAAAMVSLLTDWTQSGRKESPAELTDVFMRVIGDLNACFNEA